MKIALIGYGKMGKMVESAALSKSYTIVSKIDSHQQSISKESLANADICIDFSHPNCVVNNVKSIAALKKNIVMGTTGWYDHLDLVKEIVNNADIGFLYSPNFSLGVSLFLEIVAQAAALMAPFESYDVGGFEIHHNQKADSPSGTAKAIAKRLLANLPRKKEVIYGQPNQQIHPDTIHFSSTRFGSVPGTHSVAFDSNSDSITLTHTARNREGFANGAIRAAEWLVGKKGFYTNEDILKI